MERHVELDGDKSISFISYNILVHRYFKFPNKPEWSLRLEQIRKKIIAFNPDVICLQEVELGTREEDFIDYFTEYDSYCHVISKKRTNKMGNMILWRKSLFSVKAIDNKFNSTGVFVTLTMTRTGKEDHIRVGNIHLQGGLQVNESTRVKQINSCLIEFGKTPSLLNGIFPNIPHVLCGDFNDDLKQNGLLKPILDRNGFVSNIDFGTCCLQNTKGDHWYMSFDKVLSNNTYINVLKDNIHTEKIPNEKEPSDHLMICFKLMM